MVEIKIRLTRENDLTILKVRKIIKKQLLQIKENKLQELVSTYSQKDKNDFGNKEYIQSGPDSAVGKIGSKTRLAIPTINESLLILIDLRILSDEYGLITFKPVYKKEVDLIHELGKELIEGPTKVNQKTKIQPGQAVIKLQEWKYFLQEINNIQELEIEDENEMPSLNSIPSFKRILKFYYNKFPITKIKTIENEEFSFNILKPSQGDLINLEQDRLSITLTTNIKEQFKISTILSHDKELFLSFEEINTKTINNNPVEITTKVKSKFVEFLFKEKQPRMNIINSIAKSQKIMLTINCYTKTVSKLKLIPIKIENITDYLYNLIDKETDFLISKGISLEVIDQVIDRIEEIGNKNKPDITLLKPETNQEIDLLETNELETNIQYGDVLIESIKIKIDDQLALNDQNLINKEIKEGKNISPLKFWILKPESLFLRGMLNFKLIEKLLEKNKFELELSIQYKSPFIGKETIKVPIILKNRKAFLIQELEKYMTHGAFQAMKSQLLEVREEATYIQIGNKKIKLKLSKDQELNRGIIEAKDNPKIKMILDDLLLLYPDLELEIEE